MPSNTTKIGLMDSIIIIKQRGQEHQRRAGQLAINNILTGRITYCTYLVIQYSTISIILVVNNELYYYKLAAATDRRR